MHRTIEEWREYAEYRKTRPSTLPAVTELLEDLLELAGIPTEHMSLMIATRQWLQVLIEELDIDPEQTVIEAAAVGPNGSRVLAKIKLADTLAKLDDLKFMVTVKANNDV